MFDLLDPDARITPAQAARRLGISRQLIRDWYDRGRLVRGDDGLVRYGDVLDVEAETRNARRPGRFERKRQLIAA